MAEKDTWLSISSNSKAGEGRGDFVAARRLLRFPSSSGLSSILPNLRELGLWLLMFQAYNIKLAQASSSLIKSRTQRNVLQMDIILFQYMIRVLL
ncbi:hypothetical protein K1719_029655 [Acacia pycnantha]|nr:hypothetical protein K1719_029655 [Acacia pycnantha]